MAFLDEIGLKEVAKLISSKYVKKSGDTMSGDLILQKSQGNIRASVNDTATEAQCTLHVGAGGYNRGTWDDTANKQLVYTDKDGNSWLNGTASTANWCTYVSAIKALPKTGTNGQICVVY